MTNEERQLWRLGDLECVMISCCAGAELQLRRLTPRPHANDRDRIVLRELYPMKTDLYERARELKRELDGAGSSQPPQS